MELLLSTDIPQARTTPGPGPLVGQLDVSSTPSSIDLFVDDEPQGTTPAQLVLNAGTHEVTLVSLIGTVRRTVRVRPGHRTQYSKAIFNGSLVISSAVEVEVRIDGDAIGASAGHELVLEPGSYQLELLNLDGFVEYHGMSFTLLNRGEPDQVLTGVVSSNFFDVLGVRPLVGRTFVDADDDLYAEAVLVLSYPYWQQRFGSDPSIVGAVFEMNDQPHTVIGVLPPMPQYPRDNDVYMPTSACPFRARGEARMHEDRTAFRGMTAFGRLRNGITVEQFGTDLATVASRLQQDFPNVYQPDSGYTAVTAQLSTELTSNARPMLLILLGTTGLVLLIACANVANLTMARMMGRGRAQPRAGKPAVRHDTHRPSDLRHRVAGAADHGAHGLLSPGSPHDAS